MKKTKLNWKKGFLSSNYEIIDGGRIVGNLKENPFKRSAEGELFGKRYSYQTIGVFKQETQIYDADRNVIGRINYNTLKTSAQIEYQGRIYNWKNENWRHSKWQLYDQDGLLVEYRGSQSKGELTTNINDDFLILSGLFIANYYWQSAVAVMMVMFLLFVLVLN